MKGTLNKHEEGWLVRYGDMQFLPLHPDFIEMMDTCFTSNFTQIVDFEMVLCSHSKSKDDYYAKLINHPVESNEMIDLPKMESKLDDILANETSESLTEWIKNKREISDKDIFEQAILAMEELYGSGCDAEIDAYFRGAKWMQKQLKGGQDE